MALDFRQSTSNPIAIDIGNQVMQERIASKTIKLASFTRNKNAVWAARHFLQKVSYPFAEIRLSVNRDLFRLQVGDCFKFSYAPYSISEMVCRVLQIEEKNLESEVITIHAMEDVFAASNAVTFYEAPDDHTPDPPGDTVEPFTHQTVLESAYLLSNDEIGILPLACRETDVDLGFQLYFSIDGGSSYSLLETVAGLAPYGTLVDAYPAETYSIDDMTGITISFVADVASVDTVTWADVFSASKNTALLGDELISFRTITPVSGTQYKLEDVIRGRFGTQKVAHSAAEAFWFLKSGSTAVLHSVFCKDAALKFKLVPYNISNTGDIAEMDAIDLTFTGLAKTPYIPINFHANGSSYSARYSTDVVLTWSPRYRNKGAGIGTPGTVLADTDREGYFEVEVWVGAAKVRTTTSIDAATWTYTEVMNNADNGTLASEVLFKLLNYRNDGGVCYESDQVEVTCKKN